jgi:hypothetical protein
MRRGSYLNFILTVNAVLLGALVWGQLAARPVLAQSAAAQTSGGSSSQGAMINAAEQRQRMIEALQDIKRTVESTRTTIEAGKLRVEVVNLDQLKVAGSSE